MSLSNKNAAKANNASLNLDNQKTTVKVLNKCVLLKKNLKKEIS